MKTRLFLTAVLFAGVISVGGTPGARGGTELVAYPANYKSFPVFGTVDRPDRKVIRFFYANPAAIDAAKPGQPVPSGTVLVMEDRRARLDAQGNPVTTSEGRFVATDEVVGIFVQEKRTGWGAEYPEAKRNGEWEYAAFAPDGSRRTNMTMDGCFACHKPQEPMDYTFIFGRYILDTRK